MRIIKLFKVNHFSIRPIKRAKKGVINSIRPFRDKMLFKHYLRKNTPVFVYQMGKVGSKSIYKSLYRQYSGVVLNAHHFNPNHADWRIRRLYHWVIDQEMPLNVISPIREPIARNVSAFFQNFKKFTGVHCINSNFSLEELKGIFLAKFNHKMPLQWFDKNIKANFGIDVYVNSFPKCGYATYSHKNIRLLVMMAEINNNEKAKAIKDFLNAAEFQIINRNIGEEKEYALSYNDFKYNVKFPQAYIDMMHKSKYFNYFYEQDVINAVRKKWSEG